MISLANPHELSHKTIKDIQQQLVFILHAIACISKDKQNAACVQAGQPPRHPPCDLPNCSAFKQLTIHMRQCPLRQPCAVPYCDTSKAIYKHWRQCRNTECLVCTRIRCFVQ
ncbi:unnamed protein product [Caenorhabditis brenneri]